MRWIIWRRRAVRRLLSLLLARSSCRRPSHEKLVIGFSTVPASPAAGHPSSTWSWPGTARQLRLFNRDSSWNVVLLLPAAAIVATLLVWLWRSRSALVRRHRFITAARSQVIDRLRLGAVTDFLDFYWATGISPPSIWRFGITVGVSLLLLDGLPEATKVLIRTVMRRESWDSVVLPVLALGALPWARRLHRHQARHRHGEGDPDEFAVVSRAPRRSRDYSSVRRNRGRRPARKSRPGARQGGHLPRGTQQAGLRRPRERSPGEDDLLRQAVWQRRSKSAPSSPRSSRSRRKREDLRRQVVVLAEIGPSNEGAGSRQEAERIQACADRGPAGGPDAPGASRSEAGSTIERASTSS